MVSMFFIQEAAALLSGVFDKSYAGEPRARRPAVAGLPTNGDQHIHAGDRRGTSFIARHL